jgi:hypothetical protein
VWLCGAAGDAVAQRPTLPARRSTTTTSHSRSQPLLHRPGRHQTLATTAGHQMLATTAGHQISNVDACTSKHDLVLATSLNSNEHFHLQPNIRFGIVDHFQYYLALVLNSIQCQTFQCLLPNTAVRASPREC